MLYGTGEKGLKKRKLVVYLLAEYSISNQDGGAYKPGSRGSTLEELGMSEQRHALPFLQEKVGFKWVVGMRLYQSE